MGSNDWKQSKQTFWIEYSFIHLNSRSEKPIRFEVSFHSWCGWMFIPKIHRTEHSRTSNISVRPNTAHQSHCTCLFSHAEILSLLTKPAIYLISIRIHATGHNACPDSWLMFWCSALTSDASSIKKWCQKQHVAYKSDVFKFSHVKNVSIPAMTTWYPIIKKLWFWVPSIASANGMAGAFVYLYNIHIVILIHFSSIVLQALNCQVKMNSISHSVHQLGEGLSARLISFPSVCTDTLAHSIRFHPYDSMSRQSYSDLREPNGAAPWVPQPDQ